MKHVHLDFETYCEQDIRDVGGWRYALDPSCEVLCAAYSIDGGPVKLWRVGDPDPEDLLKAVSQRALIHAWNAAFEYAVWNYVQTHWPRLKRSQMRCSMALAAYHSLPLSLDKAGPVVEAEILKDKEGKRLINRFCKPRRPTKSNPSTRIRPEDDPEGFEALCRYCVTDVESEMAIVDKLPLKELPGIEQGVYELDLRVNERGVKVDVEACEAVIRAAGEINEILESEASEIIGDGIRTSQRAAVLEWAKRDYGVKLENYQAEYIRAKMIDEALPKEVRRVLEIRESLAKTSVTKYARMVACADPFGVVRGSIQYYGAQRTGRFAGRLIQVHNLPRGTVKGIEGIAEFAAALEARDWVLLFDKPMEALSSMIRSMLVASPGLMFFAADFANIEGRVLAWIAGQLDVVAQFASGDDLYKHMAATIFGVPYHMIDDLQRFVGKQAVLGCGYGMGADKFLATCIGYGRDIGIDLARKAVKAYRKKNSMIVKFWYEVEEAAVNAVRYPGTVFKARHVSYFVRSGYMWCRLPSGRCLAYHSPKLEDGRLSYMGVSQTTSQWSPQDTYGGKLVENIVQAVARDILVEAMLRVEDAGYDVVMTVHDEVVALTDAPSERLGHFIETLCAVPHWARGCPVAASGWAGDRYKKD